MKFVSKTLSRTLLASSMSLILLPHAHAVLDVHAPHGDKVVEFAVAGRNPEVCILPSHAPNGAYSKDDLAKEVELCSYASQGNASPTVAVCPKLNSTNPGLDIHQVPEGMAVADVVAKHCEVLVPDPADATKQKNAAKKLGKYKLSTSCSYSPSHLAYYHVSRMLGGILNTPVSVLRTWDLQNHLALGKEALAADPNGKSLIHQTWAGLMSQLQAGASAKTKDRLFVTDFTQSYGSIVTNPTNENFYKEFINGGANNVARTQNLRDKNKIIAQLSNPANLTIARDFSAANLQAMVQLKDASDMIVLDTLLNQEDRIGNIHYYDAFYYLDQADLEANGLQKLKSKINMKADKVAKLGAIQVKQMLLKDNDCGVSRSNLDKASGLTKKIAHLDPETYARLMRLDRDADSTETKAFFTQSLNFTEADFTSVRANLKDLAKQLSEGCAVGKVKLDLDLQAYFNGRTLTQVTCEAWKN